MENTPHSNDIDNALVWSAVEVHYKEKTTDWYWTLGLLTLAGSITSFIFGNWLFGIFLILGGCLIGFFASQKPVIHECRLDEEGVHYGSINVGWDDVVEWNVIGVIPHVHFIVKTKIPLRGLLVIPLGRFPGDQIVDALSESEKRNEELRIPLTHLLADKIGF